MKKAMIITISVLMLSAMSIMAADELVGGYKYEVYNTSPLIRVRYKGDKSVTATFNWFTHGYVIIEDTVTTSNALENADTVASYVGEIRAVTNLNQQHNWDAVACAALTTDDIDDTDLTDAAAAINCADGLWHEVMTVDTSAIGQADVCPWEWQAYGDADIVLKTVYGMPGLTGAKTTTVYLDDDPIWSSVVVTNYPDGVFDNQPLDAVLGGDGSGGFRIKKGAAQDKGHIVVRASATTAADSGGIGVTFSTAK